MLKFKWKYRKINIIIILIVFTGFMLSAQKYKYPSNEEIQLKVNYLSRIIKAPLHENSDILAIRYHNPEWMLFSLSYSSYALTNIAFLDTTFKRQSVELIDSAIQKVLSKTINKYYSYKSNPVDPKIDTTGSVLYFGHLNMMLGCYRLLSNNKKYDKLNDRLSENLYRRFTKKRFMCLESYPNRIWIPDNTAGLASLKLHSQNTGSTYENVCDRWIEYAKTNFIDKKTGLLCSTIDPKTGKNEEEARGSMIGWSIFFIYRFNEEFAKEQYESYKNKFSNNWFIFRLFRERSKNRKTDYYGDIDSGPIIRGYSIPANAFAFGDAVALGDLRNAKRLQRVIKFGSKKIEKENEITYKTRFVKMEISPLAEALILYFETMTEWKPEKLKKSKQ